MKTKNAIVTCFVFASFFICHGFTGTDPFDISLPSLAQYQRKVLQWTCPDIKATVPIGVYFATSVQDRTEQDVLIYLMNHAYPRIGQEPDASILSDYIKQNYIIVTVDFNGVSNAVSPDFDFDLLALQRAIYGYETESLISDIGLVPREYYCWFLPAGCRIDRDVVYFELDKHGSFGTKEKVLESWNSIFAPKFHLPQLSNPDKMYNPNGSELDYRLLMDIIYPSQPSRKLPLFFYNATRSRRMEGFRCSMNEPHMYGFAMRGYTTAIIDHCWNPLARHNSYGFVKQAYTLDQYNGYKSATAAIRFFRAHADKYAIDEKHIAGMGYSKGSYGITRLSDPDHESNPKEYDPLTGFPEGSPEPQPWQGYSSRITVGYQASGMGTTKIQYATPKQIPTFTFCGKFDKYHSGWKSYPKQIRAYEQNNINHLAIWADELGHELPYGFDKWHNRNRYDLLTGFFDQYMKPDDCPNPQVLYVFPVNGNERVTCQGYSQVLPDPSVLTKDTLDYVSLLEPITVHFAPQIDIGSVQNNGILIIKKSTNQPVSGTWQAFRDNTLFKFHPTNPLDPGSLYIIHVTRNIQNTTGTPLMNEVISEFKIGDKNLSLEDFIPLSGSYKKKL